MSKKKKEQDHDVKYWWVFPYRWNWDKAFTGMWNQKEKRILAPKQWGVGWTVNFHALWKKLSK